jgi:hypothetical protein
VAGLNEQSKDLNKNLKQSQTEFNKSKSAADGLASSLSDSVFFARDLADEAKKSSKALLGISLQASETTKAFRDVAKATGDISNEIDKLVAGETSLNDVKNQREAINRAEGNLQREYNQFLIRTLGDEELINAVKSKNLDVEEALLTVAVERGNLTEDQLDSATALAGIFTRQFEEVGKVKEGLGVLDKRSQNVARSTSLFRVGLVDFADLLDKGIRKLGGDRIADKLDLGGVSEGAKKYAAQLSNGGESVLGIGGRLKVAGKAALGFGANLTMALGPIGLISMAIQAIISLFKFFVGQAMELDKEIGDTADTLGISYEQATLLSQEAAKQKDIVSDEKVLRSEIVKAQVALNEQFGQTMVMSEKLAQDFAKTTKFLNLSEEAAQGFAKASMGTGESIENMQMDIVGVTQELNAQNGLAMSQKQIMEGVATASDAQFLAAKGSAKELAKQVFEARKLGMDLGQLEKIGGNLLDFEQSIAAEMNAEVLTGKDLNLEKARQAALEGDLATLSQEIAKNIGDSADFAEMNVLQQEALAAAVGMTREELAGSLREQEQLKAVQELFGEGATNLNKAQEIYNQKLKDGTLTEEDKLALQEAGLAEQMESQSIADKQADAQAEIMEMLQEHILPDMMEFADTMERIFNTFVRIGTFISGIFQPVVDMVKNQIESIETILKGFKQILEGDVSGGLKTMAQGVINFIASPIEALANMAIEVINLAIDGFNTINPFDKISRIPKANFKVDFAEMAEGGIIKPSIGGTPAIIGEGGESEMVLPLSKAGSMGFGGDNDQLRAEMQQVNSNLKALIAAVQKGGDVFMDGAKVGKSLVLASSNLGA